VFEFAARPAKALINKENVEHLNVTLGIGNNPIVIIVKKLQVFGLVRQMTKYCTHPK